MTIGILHHRMAVDTEDLAVNPSAVVRRQEAHDAGNVDGEADTAQRGPRSRVLEEC